MSANETVHTSVTGGQKAGNLERYDLIPAEPLRRLARHAGTALCVNGGSFHQMMAHAWAFWRGEDVDLATEWVHLIAAAWEAFRIVDPWHPPTWVLDDRRPGAERYDRIPPDALRQLAYHFGRGALKYDDDNWTKGYDWRLTFAAANRHAEQFRAGEPHDPETGSHHLIAFAWHMLVLDEFTRINRGGDTRYCTRVRAWLDAERAHFARESSWARIMPQLEEACLKINTKPRLWLPSGPRVVDFALGFVHRGAQWADRQGDRWRWRQATEHQHGGWEYFYKPSGTWAEAIPSDEYAPYTEAVEQQPTQPFWDDIDRGIAECQPDAPREPRVVDSLGEHEQDAEWNGLCGRYRYDTEHTRWTRLPEGHQNAQDWWIPTMLNTEGFGPFTEVLTTPTG